MKGFIASMGAMMANMVIEQQKQQEEFKRRAEEARRAYWDATKLPRKTKKKVRKQAREDYFFYTVLSQPIF
jgi:IMP dehydrogenase/GMP reductase